MGWSEGNRSNPETAGVSLLKTLAFRLMQAFVLPAFVLYWLAVRILPGRAVQTFQGWSQAFSLIPGTMGVMARRAFYGFTLEECADTVTISFGTILSSPAARLGRHVYIGANCMIGVATIGDDTLLGSNVDILSGRRQHHFERLDVPIRQQGGTFERVEIGRDAWIGNGAIVSANVADHAIVAAGAVVVKDVAEATIVGGNPARELGTRKNPRTQQEESFSQSVDPAGRKAAT